MIIAIHDGVEQQWTVDKEHVPMRRMARMTKHMIELYVKDKRKVRERRMAGV
jgi:hypothetical protein